MAKYDFVRYLDDNQRYDEVLKYGWEIRDDYNIRVFIEKALIQLDEKEKLNEFYKEQLDSRFDKDYLRKLKQELTNSEQNREWDDYVRSLIEKTRHLHDLLEILMLVERYEEIYRILVQNADEEVYGYEAFLINYAAKFTIINPLMAVKFYRLLLEKEVERQRKSNHYKRLMEYWGELEDLDDYDYLAEIKHQLTASHPTEKKLMELISSK